MTSARGNNESMKTLNKRHTIREHGFTLLEVLIALLVLSIGLLGLAALQTTGLRSNQMASMRTQATQVAYDITDRMRANPLGVDAGEYQITTGTTPTGTTRAEIDLIEWRDAVENLPEGQSEIELCTTGTVPACAAGSPVTHIITVYWNESRDPAASAGSCPPADNSEFRCYQLVFSE